MPRVEPGTLIDVMLRRQATSLLMAALLRVAAHPVLSLVVVAGVGAAAAFGAWEFLVPPIAWTLMGLLGAGLRSQSLPGRAIRPADEPELADLVRSVADELGFGAPISIRVAPVVDAALMRTRFRSGHAFALALGWPLLRALSKAELRAVIAHELAHEQHTADASARILAARDALVSSFERSVHLPRRLVAPLLRRTQPISFALELDADRDAASVAGADAAASALHRTSVVAGAYDMLADRWLSALEPRQERPVDLYDEVDRALTDAEVLERLEKLVRESEPATPDLLDSHPPTPARIAALGVTGGRLPGEPLRLRTQDELDAWCLDAIGFDDTFGAVRLAERDLHELRPEDDDPLDELAAATGEPAGSSALSAAVASVRDGSWRDVAERVEPSLRHAPADVLEFARLSVFGGVLSRALTPGLLRAGWAPANRWMLSALTAPDGERVYVRDLIEDATRTADDSRLRQLLTVATAEVRV